MGYIECSSGGGSNNNPIPEHLVQIVENNTTYTYEDVDLDDSFVIEINTNPNNPTTVNVTGGTIVETSGSYFKLVRPTSSTVTIRLTGKYPYGTIVYVKKRPYTSVLSYTYSGSTTGSNLPLGCFISTIGSGGGNTSVLKCRNAAVTDVGRSSRLIGFTTVADDNILQLSANYIQWVLFY